MQFSEDYSFWTLVRLYLMLLHPLFQLKYRMDPHISRFYRFLFLYTRLSIAFAITFFVMRHNSYQSDILSLILFIILGSFLYLPLPTFMYGPFRSAYYMLIAKEEGSRRNSDYEGSQPGDIEGGANFD